MKRTLFIVGGVIAVALVGAAIFIATFDPNRYKPQLVAAVESRTGRTLTLGGDISIALWPRLGAKLGPASLSERGSKAVFARVAEARIGLAIWPLLSRRAVIDRIDVSGLALELVKRKDGSFNFDDLIKGDAAAPKPASPEASSSSPSQPLEIDISQIRITDAAITWRDEGAGTTWQVTKLDATTGRIAVDADGRLDLRLRAQRPQPAADVTLTARAQYRLVLSQRAVALDDLQVKLVGSLNPDEKLDVTLNAPKFALSPKRSSTAAATLDARLTTPGRVINAKVNLAALNAEGEALEFASLVTDLDIKSGDVALTGQVRSPLSVHLGDKTARLANLAGTLAVSGPTIPNRSMQLTVAGNSAVGWGETGKDSASADLTVKFDQTNARVKINVASLSKPVIGFDLEADQLNLDRYSGTQVASKPAAGSASGSTPGSTTSGAKPAAEKPIDLSALKGLNASGRVRIGSLVVSDVKLQSLNAQIRAAGGDVNINPLSANLYQGSMAGSVIVNANANTFAVRQQLSNIAVGPMLRDLLDRDLLEGRGAVSLDLLTSGMTVSAMKRALSGNAKLNLRDGAIKGINLAEIVRRARAFQAGGLQGVQAVQTEKTDFSALNASFNIRQGVARNDDLVVESPLLRLTGAGAIDVAAGRLDYTAKTVATYQGRPINIPVKISGPLNALSYQLDMQSMLTDTVKDEVKRRVQDAVKERLGSEIGDALKGLLGK